MKKIFLLGLIYTNLFYLNHAARGMDITQYNGHQGFNVTVETRGGFLDFPLSMPAHNGESFQRNEYFNLAGLLIEINKLDRFSLFFFNDQPHILLNPTAFKHQHHIRKQSRMKTSYVQCYVTITPDLLDKAKQVYTLLGKIVFFHPEGHDCITLENLHQYTQPGNRIIEATYNTGYVYYFTEDCFNRFGYAQDSRIINKTFIS